MPSSDYTNAVGGGLKLKGAKDAGVKKHKKKKLKPEAGSAKVPDTNQEQGGENSTALQKALADEEGDDGVQQQELAKVDKDTGAGKTEAQRRHEEIRRKRVRSQHNGFRRPLMRGTSADPGI